MIKIDANKYNRVAKGEKLQKDLLIILYTNRGANFLH